MSNTFKTADILAKASLAVLDNELGFLNSMYRAPQEEFSKKVNGYAVGETISIRRPHDPRPRRGAVASVKDVIEGKVTLTCDQLVGHDFKLTNVERTLNVTDLTERVVKPAMVNIVNDIARDVLEQFYLGTYNWVGTPGQTINSFGDFAKGPERMDEMCIPDSDRFAILSSSDAWAMVGAQTLLNNGSMVSSAFREGELGMVGGLKTFRTQVLPTHTNGAAVDDTAAMDGAAAINEVSYESVKDTWKQTIVTDGWGNNQSLTAGTVFNIADVYMVNAKTKARTEILQDFVVMTTTTTHGSGGDTQIEISPPIITSGPHQTVVVAGNGLIDDNAITVKGDVSTGYRQNIMAHKNAMTLAFVPLEMPAACEGIGSRQSHKGISVRVIPAFDAINNEEFWRLDVLYARRLIDPRLSTRASGTSS